jgi:hypothetical protein
MRSASSRSDATLREFETRDLGDDLRGGVVVRQQPTSILLPLDLKERLRRRGAELGIGYQTLAKMILAKYAEAKL